MSVHHFMDGRQSHISGWCEPWCPFWEKDGEQDTVARIDAENQEFFREIEGITENLDGR